MINIIYVDNGVGLTKDANLLKSILESAGHQVNLIDKFQVRKFGKADIAIHLEICQSDFFGLGKTNIYIPNPEWYQWGWDKFLNKYQVIVAKTHDCERIFKSKHLNVVYTGFTSEDRYKPCTKFFTYLHSAGQSETKGTKHVYEAWKQNSFKNCVLLSKKYKYASLKNLKSGQWAPENEYKDIQNMCLVHICPSLYEGFGHYINEAMSTGAVIVTTDAEPMREFVRGNGFLIKPVHYSKMALGQLAHINSQTLANTIKIVEQYPYETLLDIGKVSRQMFLENDKLFKHRFLQLISEL